MSLVQWVTFGAVIASMGLEAVWMARHRKVYLKAAPLFIVLLHTFVFYLTLVLNMGIPHTVWSSILRLHVVLTILGLAVFRNLEKR